MNPEKGPGPFSWGRANLAYLIMATFVVAVVAIQRTYPEPTYAKEEQAKFLETFRAQQQALETRLKEDQPLAIQVGSVMLVMLLLCVLGLYLDGRWLSSVLARRRLWFEAGPPSEAAWPVGDLIRVVIAFLFAAKLLELTGLSGVVIFRVTVLRWLLHPAVMQLVLDLIAVMLVVQLVRRSGQALADLGLKTARGLSNLAAGIVGYTGILPVFFASAMAVLGVARALKYEPPPEPAIELVLREGPGPMFALLLILIVSVGPIAEEIVFRGFAYPALRKRVGVWWGMVVNSGCFALLHGSLIGFLPIFSLGMALSYLYEKTGSLVPCFTLHILHNSMMAMLLLALKDLLWT